LECRLEVVATFVDVVFSAFSVDRETCGNPTGVPGDACSVCAVKLVRRIFLELFLVVQLNVALLRCSRLCPTCDRVLALLD
jgi:hypothetical protein